MLKLVTNYTFDTMCLAASSEKSCVFFYKWKHSEPHSYDTKEVRQHLPFSSVLVGHY